jgi:protein LSM14
MGNLSVGSAPPAKAPQQANGRPAAPSSANLPAVPHAAAAAAARQGQTSPRQTRAVPGSGGRAAPRAERSVFDQGAGRGPAAAAPVEVPDSDFDFAAANARFEKERETAAGSPEQERGAAEGGLDAIPPPAAEPKSFL